jgi:hypothetical protein
MAMLGEREISVGDVVLYFDEHGQKHNALVLNVLGDHFPKINLVYVEDTTLGYGSVESRLVVHLNNRVDHGRFWKFI